METIVHDPADDIYSTSGDYVHAIEVRQPNRFLYVSGTMGLDKHGVPGNDIDSQLDLIWSNIKAILKAAGMRVENIVRLTSYLRDEKYAEKNATARVKALNGRLIPTTAIVAQTLNPNWLVEIEIIAAD